MSILFLLFVLLLAACFVVVLITGSILWYEEANRRPELIEDRFRSDRVTFALRYLAMETFAILLALASRPLGWFNRQEQKERDRISDREAVILLHGLFHNRGSLFWLAWRLRRQGLPVFTYDLHLWRDPELAVENLAARIEELTALGATRIHLVGYSMGGLIARACLRRPQIAARVGRCILVAAPNAGSRLAPLAISATGLHLLPGSEYLQDLNEEPPPAGVKMVAIYSRHDNLVIPAESARLEGARNMDFGEMGHTTLLFHPAIAEAIATELTGNLP